MTTAVLTEERLARIRSDIEDGEFGKRDDSEQYEAAELLLGEVDRLQAALREAEEERLLLAEGYIAVDESETRYVHWDTLQLAQRIVATAEREEQQ